MRNLNLTFSWRAGGNLKTLLDCFVVGDAVWDLLAARRSGMLGIGVLTGGIGRTELTQAGAYRVYSDAAELDARRHELGLIIG